MEQCGAAPARGEVLVNGATGGVASVAIDVPAQRGDEAVAVTSKPAGAQYLRELGARSVIGPQNWRPAAGRWESARWAGARRFNRRQAARGPGCAP